MLRILCKYRMTKLYIFLAVMLTGMQKTFTGTRKSPLRLRLKKMINSTQRDATTIGQHGITQASCVLQQLLFINMFSCIFKPIFMNMLSYMLLSENCVNFTNIVSFIDLKQLYVFRKAPGTLPPPSTLITRKTLLTALCWRAG